MSALTPTTEQQAAVDAFTTGSTVVVHAGAGTGKTSTLRLLAYRTFGAPMSARLKGPPVTAKKAASVLRAPWVPLDSGPDLDPGTVASMALSSLKSFCTPFRTQPRTRSRAGSTVRRRSAMALAASTPWSTIQLHGARIINQCVRSVLGARPAPSMRRSTSTMSTASRVWGRRSPVTGDYHRRHWAQSRALVDRPVVVGRPTRLPFGHCGTLLHGTSPPVR